MTRSLDVVVLAGGEGKRMRTRRPKVLMDLLGRPVIGHVLDAARTLKPRRVVIVGGGNLPQLKEALRGEEALAFVRQAKPLGTAHAVKQAFKQLPSRGDSDVLILNGDGPLITGRSLKKTLAAHRRRKAAVTVVSAHVEDPTGLGRILRDSRGRFRSIVEEKDATAEQRTCREINAGQYAVRLADLRKLLPRIKRGNVQGEYYLTDLVGLAGDRVHADPLEDAEQAQGINSVADWQAALAALRQRILEEHLAAGVTILDPDLTHIEVGVSIGEGCVIHPFTVIRSGVSIAARSSVGPFAHLRAGTRLGEDVRVGDFVEIKASTLDRGSRALHLAYLGDARIGKGVNVGAGTITANFDGQQKHATIVEDAASLGSGTVLVAPVTVGRGARTGAGAVVPAGRDVAAGDTVIGVPARSATGRRSPARHKKRR